MIRTLLAAAGAASLATLACGQRTILTLPGAAPGSTFVRSAGDVNGDGLTDLCVARSTIDWPRGSVRVYSADGTVLYDFFSPPADFFATCAGAGDVNGDGFDDIVIGSTAAAGGYGSIWIYSGIDGAELYRIDGPIGPLSWNFGGLVAPAGDVNADGFADVIATSRTPLSPERQMRYLVFSGADGSILHSLDVRGEGSIAGAGDVDADGFDDFVLNAILIGAVHVYSGRDGSLIHAIPQSTFGLLPTSSGNYGLLVVNGAGDVDADGHDDVIIGLRYLQDGVVSVISGATGNRIYQYQGRLMPDVSAGDLFGSDASGVGDVDGDGFADFAISAPDEDELIENGGSVRVFSGADGSLIHVFHGAEIANERLGVSIDGGLGCDVDGDGYDDVLAGTHASIAFAFDVGSVGAPGFLRTRGAACLGSNGRLPTIRARGAARLGAGFDVGMRGGLDNGTALLYVGIPDYLPLDAIGMPRCTLYLAPFMSLLATTDANGMASFGVTVPPDPASFGLALEMQWVSWDPAITPIGARLSDGLRLVIGI